MELVLGFRPHTYWTAVVALSGPIYAPNVLARRKITFAEGHERFIFHQAEEAGLDRAAEMIEGAHRATEARAGESMTQLMASLDGRVVRAVVPTGGGKLPESLADRLANHSRIHAAEGEFYRNVVAAACEQTGLKVVREIERELPALVADRLGEDRSALDARLRALGAQLGAPWSVDQRLATLAAWLHL